MNDVFMAHVESLPGLLDQLLTMTPVGAYPPPKSMPTHGVYLFSEAEVHLYVGRSNRLRKRMCDHARASSPGTKSAFAFQLAREATGKITASYKVEGSRKELMKDQLFVAEFVKAKQRVAQMDLRYVEIIDPVRQTLFEVYAAMTLKTPYNSFDNH